MLIQNENNSIRITDYVTGRKKGFLKGIPVQFHGILLRVGDCKYTKKCAEVVLVRKHLTDDGLQSLSGEGSEWLSVSVLL